MKNKRDDAKNSSSSQAIREQVGLGVEGEEGERDTRPAKDRF